MAHPPLKMRAEHQWWAHEAAMCSVHALWSMPCGLSGLAAPTTPLASTLSVSLVPGTSSACSLSACSLSACSLSACSLSTCSLSPPALSPPALSPPALSPPALSLHLLSLHLLSLRLLSLHLLSLHLLSLRLLSLSACSLSPPALSLSLARRPAQLLPQPSDARSMCDPPTPRPPFAFRMPPIPPPMPPEPRALPGARKPIEQSISSISVTSL